MFPLLGEVFVFTPPKDWKLLKPQGDSRYVLLTYAAPEPHYPPSLALAHEPLHSSQREYLDAVFNLLSRNSKTCRKLGVKELSVGKCTLFQTENSTAHGIFSTLVALFFSDDEAYTISFASKKESFAQLFPTFENVLSSTAIAPTIENLLSDSEKAKLENAKTTLQKQLPNDITASTLSKRIAEDKKVQKFFTQLELSITQIMGKDKSVHTFYILKDIVAEMTKEKKS